MILPRLFDYDDDDVHTCTYNTYMYILLCRLFLVMYVGTTMWLLKQTVILVLKVMKRLAVLVSVTETV